MYNQIYSAISCAVRQGKMSTRVSLETCRILAQMEEDGVNIKAWSLEEGYVTVTTNQSTFTL